MKTAKIFLYKKLILNIFLILFLGFLSSYCAFADSTGSSYDPGSGKDPWAIFQLMISVGGEIWYVIKIALLISGVVGLVFIVLGLLKIRSHALDSQGSGGHLKHGIILVILGGVLFGVPTWMQLTGTSLFGSAPAPVATQTNVNCEMVTGQYSSGACGTAPCSAGTEASNAGYGCDPCANGTGNSKAGGSCQPCAANQETNSAGVCESCSSGQILSGGVCQSCPSGEVNISNVCSCPQGMVSSSDPSSPGCEPCSSNNDNYGKFAACPCVGRFSNTIPPNNFKNCPVHYCNPGQLYNTFTCVCSDPNSAVFNGSCTPCAGSVSFLDGSCNCANQFKMTASGCSPCQSGDYGNNSACTCPGGRINGGNCYMYSYQFPVSHCSAGAGNVICQCVGAESGQKDSFSADYLDSSNLVGYYQNSQTMASNESSVQDCTGTG